MARSSRPSGGQLFRALGAVGGNLRRTGRWLSAVDSASHRRIVLALITSAVVTALGSVSFSRLVDALVVRRSTEAAIGLAVGSVVLAGVAKACDLVSKSRIEYQYGQSRRLLRDRLVSAYSSLDLAATEDARTNSRFTGLRENGDVQAALLAVSFYNTLGSLAAFGAFLVTFLFVSPLLALGAVAACVPGLLSVGRVQIIRSTIRDGRTTDIDRQMAYESILTARSHSQDLRVFGLRGNLLTRWRSLVRADSESQQDEARTRIRRNVQNEAPTFVLELIVVVLATVAAARGVLSVGSLVLICTVLALMRTSFVRVAQGAGELAENVKVLEELAHLDTLKPVIETEDPLETDAVADDGPRPDGVRSLELCRATFRYDGSRSRQVLDGVSIRLQRGQVTGLVGRNGAGKSTLVRLLARLYDPDSGEVRIDGRDIRTLRTDRYRSLISVVGQDFSRFPLSMRFNVFLGDEHVSADDEVRMSAVAGLDFGEQLPHGWATVLSRSSDEDGAELSGGQWQRIAVARALARDSVICLLDEPTASLDALAELELFRAYRSLMRDRISLLVTHRFTSAAALDRIVVLDRGVVVGDGPHDELMSGCDLYRTMYEAQRSALNGDGAESLS